MSRLPTASIIAIILWAATVLVPRTEARGSAQADIRQSGQTLTDDSMLAMLDGLGYEPKKLKAGYLISIKKDTWTYNMQVVISPDKSKVGINANLGAIADLDLVTAVQWRTLLADSRDIDPSSFYLDKDQKKLYLHRVIDNRSITAAYIRQQVDNFCSNLHDTSKDWAFTK